MLNKKNIVIRSGWRKKIEQNRFEMQDDTKYILKPLFPQFRGVRAKELPLDAVRVLLLTEGPYHDAFNEDG